jgi:hypothetical protein
MKLKVVIFYLILFFSINQNGVAQENLDKNSVPNIDKRIVEVYGEYVSELLKKPLVLQTITEIVQKRTEIVYEPFKEYEKFEKLSNFPLFNEYNPNLERDKEVDPYTFNVLKYDLPFFPNLVKIYRIDNSDYVLIIFPLNYKN